MNLIEKFLLICSGSDFRILRKCPTDKNKHIGIGGVILFTALLATLSAGYALYTVFDSVWAAVAFGIFWGLMIFNLDRYIVASMRKSGNYFSQFMVAIPRLILAGLLGIIISKPLELKIFEKEIGKQLNVIINRNKQELQDSVNYRYAAKVDALKSERKTVFSRIDNLREAYNVASQELEKEIVGTSTETTTGKKGFGPNAKRKAEQKQQKKEELDSYLQQVQPQIKEYNESILSLDKQKESELAKANSSEDNYTGFAARMQALDELGKNNAIIASAAFFIMLLFVSMEMAPVLVKLIAPKGPYDHYLEKHEYSFRFFNWESRKKTKQNSEERVGLHRKRSDRRLREEI